MFIEKFLGIYNIKRKQLKALALEMLSQHVYVVSVDVNLATKLVDTCGT